MIKDMYADLLCRPLSDDIKANFRDHILRRSNHLRENTKHQLLYQISNLGNNNDLSVTVSDKTFKPAESVTPETQLTDDQKTLIIRKENENLTQFIRSNSDRLRQFNFRVDDSLEEEFAMDNWNSPNPTVRISRPKYNWLEKIRKYEETLPTKPTKKTNQAELIIESDIDTMIIELEGFVTRRLIWENTHLINRYKKYYKFLQDQLRELKEEKSLLGDSNSTNMTDKI